jgi:hypothetical protein
VAEDNVAQSLPETEPHPAPIFDTGPHPQPLESSSTNSAPAGDPEHASPAPAQSVVVPGHYHFLPWWKLVLVMAAVWVPAAAIGLGLFSWWYSLADKTPAVFVLLVYIVACTVGALMLAMVQNKPLVAALAIAVMTAVFASTVAAAPLYGHYYCQVKSPCLAGIIPY